VPELDDRARGPSARQLALRWASASAGLGVLGIISMVSATSRARFLGAVEWKMALGAAIALVLLLAVGRWLAGADIYAKLLFFTGSWIGAICLGIGATMWLVIAWAGPPQPVQARIGKTERHQYRSSGALTIYYTVTLEAAPPLDQAMSIEISEATHRRLGDPRGAELTLFLVEGGLGVRYLQVVDDSPRYQLSQR
jgi:hypothetical protein